MSTLRISNIEAKSVPASATTDEKIKITNSSGDVLVFLDGKTSGITTVGINTTDGNIKFDANSNVVVTGIITATKFVGTIEPTDLTVSGKVSVGGSVTAATFYGNGANLTGITGTTINNNADNRLITGSGTANTLNAESDITYDGTILALAGGKYINSTSPYRVAGHPVLGYDNFTDISGGSYATRLGSTGTSTLRSTQIYGGGSHLATFDGVNSRLGLRTTTPAKDLHVYNPSVSTVRIETGDSRGQAWDILSTNGAQNNTGTLSFRDESGASYMEFGANGGSPQFRVRNGGSNDLLYIDSSGRVTKPLQPSFYGRGYNGTNNNNWKFDAVASSNGEHNQGNHFNNNTGIFTCPVAGHYFIGGGWGYTEDQNYCMMGFRYNGNTQLNLWEDGRAAPNGNAKHVSASFALVIQCNANDTLSFVHDSNYSAPSTNTQYAWGSIYLVG